MATLPPPATHQCTFCGTLSAGARSCPGCGAPVDVTLQVSNSGWVEMPAVRDMTHIQLGQSSLQIEGALVPVADFSLVPGDGIYFGHHDLLWKDVGVPVVQMNLRGGWSRMMAGLPLHMLTATGPGHIALSRDHPGEMMAIPIHPAHSVDVREHLFVCATSAVAYNWNRAGVWYQTRSGSETETHYPMGMYMDTFSSPQAGLLVLHTQGNAYLRQLGPGESILVKPQAFVYKDTSVGCHLHFEHPANTFRTWRSWGERYLWLRLVGPGRVAVQSAAEHHHDEGGRIVGSSSSTRQQW